MFGMMSATGYPLATLFFWFLHWVGGTLWIAAVILGIAWAIKNLAAGTLKSLAIWMFAIGMGLAILTAPASIAGWRWFVDETMGSGTMSVNRGRMMQLRNQMQWYAPGQSEPQFQQMRDAMDQLLQEAADRDDATLRR